jgi:hypothetical protein
VKKSGGQSGIKVFHSKLQCYLPPAAMYRSDVWGTPVCPRHLASFAEVVDQIKTNHKWNLWIYFCMSAEINTLLPSRLFSKPTTLLAGQPGIEVRFQTVPRTLSPFQRLRTGFVTQTVLWSTDTSSIFPGIERPGREANNSPPSSAAVKIAWSYSYAPLRAFKSRSLIKHSDNRHTCQ